MNPEEQKLPVENPTPEVPPAQAEPAEPYATPSPTLEDKPVEPAAPAAAPAAAPVIKKESWLKRAFRWVEVALLFLLIGAGVVYFALALPANNRVASLNAAAATSADKITALEADLKTAQSSIASQNADLASVNLKNAVYKMKMDVNTIRVALLKLDPISATQALGTARADLLTLSALKVDAATLDGFTTRLDNAEKTLATDPQKSMVELDNLIDNLYLLESNLK